MNRARARFPRGKAVLGALILFVASGQNGGCPFLSFLFPQGSDSCAQGTVAWDASQRGTTVSLDGSSSFDPNGGTLAFSWSELDNSPSLDPATQSSAVATFQAPFNGAFSYRLTVTNTAGQTDSCTVTVTVSGYPSPPQVDTQGSPVPGQICIGGTATLAVVPIPGVFIDWFVGNCGGTAIGSGDSIAVSPTSTTTYFAIARTANGLLSPGCGSATITVIPLPNTPTSQPASPSAICVGSSASLSAGVGPEETVDWFTGTCGGTLVGSGNPLAVSPATNTTYFARARNTSLGCVSVMCSQVQVRVNPLPACSIEDFDSPPGQPRFCGPANMITYQWSIVSSTGATFATTTNARCVGVNPGIGPGSFTLTLTITDVNGCTSICNRTIQVPPPT